MPLWDENCDNLVDQHLNIDDTWAGRLPRYKHPTSLNLVEDCNLPNGIELISNLYTQMVENWEVGGSPQNRSGENWRFERRTGLDPRNDSSEVILERTIISVVYHGNWANQIPVDSGILNRRSRYLDLAYKEGNTIELIELKVGQNADTPLSAAFQILKYGLINAFFRLHSNELNTAVLQTPLLSADNIKLRVLAPAANYGYFEDKIEWLKKLEKKLSEGLAEFTANQLNEGPEELSTDQLSDIPTVEFTGFQFDQFPDDFHWDPSRILDQEYRNEVLAAVHGRHRI